ncbi:MAG: hypothetical protein ACP6IY_13125 [Promethearchaeia archaeon]
MSGTTESEQILPNIEIPLKNIQYDKKEKRITINILGFVFIGQYFPRTRLKEVLDDFHASLRKIKVNRDNIYIKDPKSGEKIPEDLKIKQFYSKFKFLEEFKEKEFTKQEFIERLHKEEKIEREKEEIEEVIPLSPEKEEVKYAARASISVKKKKTTRKPVKLELAAPMAPPKMMETKKEPVLMSAQLKDLITERSSELESEFIPETKKINMGLQYYSVMMENQTYLFYVYFSHKKLIIEDEEGKTVYETTFEITVTKEEPPKLKLSIEGIGFEVHPISCVVQVDENAFSQPTTIFSITPLKNEDLSEKERKKGYRRFLHIIVEFEGDIVSHTVLAAIIQPKHINLKLGPVQLNLSKAQALLVCLLSISITAISSVYSILSMDLSATASNPNSGVLGSFIPGAGSLIFMLSFIITILKKGVFPIKKKVAGMLDFTKSAALIK